MIRRLALFLALALWIVLPAHALFFTPPPMLVAAHCVGTMTTVTASGAGSVTIPVACYHVTLKAWGGGSAGSGVSGTSDGGNGGGFATYSTYSVTPGNTLYYSVAAAITGTTAEGSAGNNSWLNISSNAQPAAIANGIYATGGATSSSRTGGSYGPTGATGYTGGVGSAYGVSWGGGGGGGGAGSAGNGGTTTSSGTAGSAGSPDGGAGGNGGSAANGSPGTQPGGAGGGANGTSKVGGNGAAGKISYQWST